MTGFSMLLHSVAFAEHPSLVVSMMERDCSYHFPLRSALPSREQSTPPKSRESACSAVSSSLKDLQLDFVSSSAIA